MSYARIPQGACFYMATVLEASLDHKRNLKLQAVASSSVLLPVKFSTSTARNGPSFRVGVVKTVAVLNISSQSWCQESSQELASEP